MSAWDELVAAALLGTQRRRPDPAALPAPVRPLATGEPEAALLRAAAVLANYRRAGHAPARPQARLPVAPRDERPLVPPLARRRLPRLPADLLPEWLTAVHEAGLRVPPEQLPALAEAARTRVALRAPLAAVAGPAGSWLGERNPAWSFLVSAPAGADVWEYGSARQRREWLDRTLEEDPAAARSALAATWAREPAGVRAEFLHVLGEHLTADDEPFLETALDDRAGPVRVAAADLLARLPGSRLAARMRERAARLVRPDGDALRVTPPDPADAALRRDLPGGGDLVRGVVAATPLAHWAPYGAPAQVLARPVTGADPRVLHAGWASAAGRQRDTGWVAAALDAAGPQDGAVAGMVRLLPPQLHRAAVSALAAKLAPPTMAAAVADLPAPWSVELGSAVLDWLATHPGDRGLGAAARAAGSTVPTPCLRHPIATAPVPVGAAPWWRALGTTLTVRREMHEELR
ncbi:DUF5691 domain-containing protein [Pseudonocardia kunmingensis]|uniref:Uncharacterized protein n=1 Tax=Pseudonocardia kunmingensis TaxID=630975 RepID=A0A543DNR9_9PSEU|nr:DUF5691 domain-containing protein [Pseudonocardia kunmingensis]TQM10969.1 hypothetical protein FB558_3493 [Pseudonocardia kunmingensis]